MKKHLLSLLLISICLSACAQKNAQNKYGLKIVNDFATYKADVANNPKLELVDIKKAIPSVVLDIRYATKNNFMKQAMYKQARAFARKPVVEKLKLIQAELKKKGYGLKIYDGYRPYSVTVSFYEKASDKNFVANPSKGSKHNRGCAVDLSIIDLKTGKDVPMPTPYDSFEAAAAPHYTDLPAHIIKNRDFLISTMQANGFKVIYNEWWHFDFIGWQAYDLMDIPFEKL
ncbi:M15 family metallopeptidase [Pedobacter xixiisoli]|uniref:D-alanyl-D-alanine dipeptidase n=1 Tax=Pedobacter xixiisoli TaxID=1476464 RepID=A0A286ADK4_9SPHI|nr:M15 family metallopeptidase [Pedobacter xixiisoli]SOD19981.1 D-alanyl-D-alanine dipeptidase [Pedobacter xixiisoli]